MQNRLLLQIIWLRFCTDTVSMFCNVVTFKIDGCKIEDKMLVVKVTTPL